MRVELRENGSCGGACLPRSERMGSCPLTGGSSPTRGSQYARQIGLGPLSKAGEGAPPVTQLGAPGGIGTSLMTACQGGPPHRSDAPRSCQVIAELSRAEQPGNTTTMTDTSEAAAAPQAPMRNLRRELILFLVLAAALGACPPSVWRVHRRLVVITAATAPACSPACSHEAPSHSRPGPRSTPASSCPSPG